MKMIRTKLHDGLFSVPGHRLASRQTKLSGSLIGSSAEIRDVLQVAADKDMQLKMEERPMKEAGQTVVDLDQGKASYIYVLMNK
jgi:alcohol dehydrogenase (NADP+)